MSFHTDPRLLAIVPTTVFAGLTALIAVVPALQMRERFPVSEDARPLSASALRGRDVFLREGCSYCHTEQVRSDTRLPEDPQGRFPVLGQDARYGRPSRPEDYAAEDPPLLGSERTGPDLFNVWDRMPSAEWHFTHLYDPRSLVPASVMPPFPFLFRTRDDHKQDDRQIVVPDSLREKAEPDAAKRPGAQLWATPDAQDLIEYLRTLRVGSRPP